MYNDARDKFLQDEATARAVMTKFGLSPENQDLLLSGDLEEILTTLDEEFGRSPGDHLLP
jgi:hypothetical protein